MLPRKLDVILEKQLEHRLELVERALQKVEEDSYDFCDARGEWISKKHL